MAQHTAPAGATTEDDQLRAGLRAMWGSVATAWGAHADVIDARGAVVADALLARVAPVRGERLLEVGSGPGGLGLLAAERLRTGDGADIDVVLSDVAPEMVAIAARRAAERGLRNVESRVLDAERLDEPDASYDVVLCREALMLVCDPARAAREFARVLRAGGRVGVAVWGPRAANPWLGALFDAVTAETGASVPPPGIPGPFSLDQPGLLCEVLADGGFSDITVDQVPTPLRVRSVDEWWEIVPSLAGPLAQVLAAMPAPVRAAIRERAAAALATDASRVDVDSDRAGDDGLEIPGVSLVATARRP
jgi:SAM-dependent methyltransferase